MIIDSIEVFKIPYSYYGTATKDRRDFDIYVVSGLKSESDDYKLLQELYHNHEILNEIYNLEFFNISLSKKYVTIVLYDYVKDPSYNINVKNHLSNIPDSKLPLPSSVKSRLDFSDSHHGSKRLHKGILKSNGDSSNIALFDRIYNTKD